MHKDQSDTVILRQVICPMVLVVPVFLPVKPVYPLQTHKAVLTPKREERTH